MQQFNTVLILVVCGLYATSVAGAGCSEDGFYVDEKDCQKYFRCVEGRRFDFNCNVGTNFDTDLFTCVHSDKANCVNSGIKQTTWKPNTSPGPAPLTADCPNGDGFWVVEGDCSRFYGCTGGIRHNFECESGWKYNSDYNGCVKADQAKC